MLKVNQLTGFGAGGGKKVVVTEDWSNLDAWDTTTELNYRNDESVPVDSSVAVSGGRLIPSSYGTSAGGWWGPVASRLLPEVIEGDFTLAFDLRHKGTDAGFSHTAFGITDSRVATAANNYKDTCLCTDFYDANGFTSNASFRPAWRYISDVFGTPDDYLHNSPEPDEQNISVIMERVAGNITIYVTGDAPYAGTWGPYAFDAPFDTLLARFTCWSTTGTPIYNNSIGPITFEGSPT